jgi:acyl-CoA thioesterase-1
LAVRTSSNEAWLARHWPLVAITGLAIAIAHFFAFRRASLSHVRNLHSRGTNIIAFGDSLTAGYGASAGEDYPSRLSALVDTTIVNAGVSGDTTDTALARLDADVLARDPRIVIVGLGGNDFLHGVDIKTTEANLRTIVEKIQAAGAMVVILGFRFPTMNADYEAMYKRVAKDEKCLFVANLLRGIITDPQLKSDEIHPNAKGYQLMAERIAPDLRRLMKAATR